MNDKQWNFFCSFRQNFKAKVQEWNDLIPQLQDLQKKAALQAGTPLYPFETPVVYNTDLDKITASDQIKLIVIGDNPGKDEQLAKNQRYLCGQAGKIAEGYFKRHPELKIDFRKNVIILNKTPVHSAKTNQLRTMMKNGGGPVEKLILESQLWMARTTAQLTKQLEQTELWLVGYSELKNKGFFVPYRNELKLELEKDKSALDRTYVFQHFSMNRFTIDLDAFVRQNNLLSLPLIEQLHCLGEFHKKEIFEAGL